MKTNNSLSLKNYSIK